jgi:collagenase-like PrtC family protease
LSTNLDYTKLKNIDKIYIPLHYFANKKFENIINVLSRKARLYIYMPIIVKDMFVSSIKAKVNTALTEFNISGIVVSNISELNIISELQNLKDIELTSNYTFNVYNSYTTEELVKLGFQAITLSPELTSEDMPIICPTYKYFELIAYGKIPLMTMSYCLLGKSNKCYKDCKKLCMSQNNFYLNDRYNFDFRVIPDNLQTITTIYNSRPLQIDYSNLDINTIRFDILDETIEEINQIIM